MSDRERRISSMVYGDPGMTRQEAAEYYLGLEEGGLRSLSDKAIQRHKGTAARDTGGLSARAWLGLNDARDADENRIRRMLYGDPGMTRAQAAEYYLGLEKGGLSSMSKEGIQRHMGTAARDPTLGGVSTLAWLGLNDARDARQEAARRAEEAARQAASLRWLEEPKR